MVRTPSAARRLESKVGYAVNKPLPSPSGFMGGKRYTALFDCTARTADDLTFSTRDILEVIDYTTEEWWIARTMSTSAKGCIPSNYLAPVERVDPEPWYLPEIKRRDAERLLLSEGNKQGAFLIRNSESFKGELSLSVLHQGRVKHYKLQKQDDNYFLSRNKSFPTLKAFVEYYSRQSDVLCVCLGEPCRKMEDPQTYGLACNTADPWEIDRSSIKLLRKIIDGLLDEVFEGVLNGTTPVAVKTRKPGTMDAAEFLGEAQLMKKLRHPKLIQLYAVCTLEEPVYIITELMTNGCLLEYLRKDKGATLYITHQIEMAAQVAAGMAYLEQQNYIHTDLTARNVLVGENNVCKVTNFGLAGFLRKNENVYEAEEGTKFPVKWTAPEAIHDNKFSIKSDVWSFGILLYEIMTFGQMPYPNMKNMQAVTWISKGNRMSCPANCPKPLHNIMLDCWKEKEKERPTFETLQWQLEEYFEMEDENPYSTSLY
ncbi:PREDICTED: tyrosine-protein kinase SRK2-like [Cyprinodon variegatus]|uniref:Tyrosine-protein kinase n=1 Tax=Cyprinodon variegatus TaxID=28743 RepID=A0A3Q2FJX7_CYPVA|nr:PREDICTED: tyrosine-protein kinase SRK2-like [Cyprinodon variegatus]